MIFSLRGYYTRPTTRARSDNLHQGPGRVIHFQIPEPYIYFPRGRGVLERCSWLNGTRGAERRRWVSSCLRKTPLSSYR